MGDLPARRLLQGLLDAYGNGVTVAQAAALDCGQSVLAQPKHLPTPARADRSGWDYDGPLAVVYTGLPGGAFMLPVRLPQGADQFERVVHFLADPRTATIDHARRERLHATVLAGRTRDFLVTAQFSGEAAQQEGPVGSTIHHNPAATSDTGADGEQEESKPPTIRADL